MASLSREIEGESLLYVLRHGAEKRKQAEQLEFAVARLELFLREMQTHSQNYFALASIIVELSCMTDSPFDLVGMLHREMDNVLGSTSLPSSQEVLEFYDEWAELFPEVNQPKDNLDDVPLEERTLRHFGFMAAIHVPTADEVHDEEGAWVESKADEVWKLLLAKTGHGSAFAIKWSRFPLMCWLIQSALAGAIEKRNYGCVTLNTNFDSEPYRDSKFSLSQRLIASSPMAWVMLGETIVSAASSSSKILDLERVRVQHKESGMERLYKDLVMVVLPNFLAKLIRLKSVLNAQAVQASQTQTKIVATAASGFVAVSNATIAYFTKSQSSCSCE